MNIRNIKRIIKFSHLLAVIGAFLAYTCLFIPPDKYFIAGLYAFTVPIWWGYHLLTGFLWFLRRKKALPFLSFLFVLVALPVWFVTFSWEKDTNITPDFTVFSYNVRVFNSYPEHHKGNLDIPKRMISHLSETDADILCFQEDYNNASDKRRIFHTEKVFKEKGWVYAARDVRKFNPPAHQFGLTIYSKFPILAYERIPMNTKLTKTNGAMYADVLVNDSLTIRVVNVHLQSMHLQEHELQDATVTTTNILARLRRAMQLRSVQARQLTDFADKSPYPIVICGDLNEIPYSYAYFKLRRSLNNAFEKLGTGFGFTYNGRLLSFLRIDHQFFSDDLQITSFQTNYAIKYSDHFPMRAGYKYIGK